MRTWPVLGDPERSCPVKHDEGCLNRGGPMSVGKGECADWGRFSGDGEEVMFSSTPNNGVGPGRQDAKLKG